MAGQGNGNVRNSGGPMRMNEEAAGRGVGSISMRSRRKVERTGSGGEVEDQAKGGFDVQVTPEMRTSRSFCSSGTNIVRITFNGTKWPTSRRTETAILGHTCALPLQHYVVHWRSFETQEQSRDVDTI